MGNFLQIQSCDITELSMKQNHVDSRVTTHSMHVYRSVSTLDICIDIPAPILQNLHLYVRFLWYLIHDIRSILNTQFHNVHGRRITIKWGITFFGDLTRKLIALPLHWFYWTSSQTISINHLGVPMPYFPGVRRNPFHTKRHPTKMKGNDFCSTCFFFFSPSTVSYRLAKLSNASLVFLSRCLKSV